MDLTEIVTRLVFQLAVILAAAKLGGELAYKLFKVPPVLGELIAGVIIGPFALGGMHMGSFGPLFELPAAQAGQATTVPVSPELYAISQIAAILLLFVAGLETDFRQFFKYVGPASVVAVGGVVLPFAFGVAATILFGFAKNAMDPAALFMGAIMTATSVGITARVLSETRKLDTPEGVTILGAAVVDDVLGILVLTIVVGIVASGSFSASNVAVVGVKAIAFWLGLTGLGILLSQVISRWLLSFQVSYAAVGLALALAFFASGLAESFGLAMIIGAYSIGLALSATDAAKKLLEPMGAVAGAFVPIFFVVMGMLVNIPAMGGALVFGAVLTVLAIVGKLFGCGLPALGFGFNRRGASRIGVGMIPRGEVALIVAGVGLSRGIIQDDMFGVAIMMTVVTTVLAPILMVPLFKSGGTGRRGATQEAEAHPHPIPKQAPPVE